MLLHARRAILSRTVAPEQIKASAVADQVREAQVRAMHEIMSLAQVASVGFALAVTFILWRRVDHHALVIWLTIRLLISAARTWHSLVCLREPQRHRDRTYVVLAMADGINWGSLGWGLTPIQNLEVAVVTICVGATAACIGVIMLHVHPKANWLFISPILVPNAVYALQRTDDLGAFCSAGFMGLTVVLLIEADRLHRRSTDLLRLRFESEQAHQAEKRALQRLQQLTDMRSRFVATISHEMRTPLHGMMGMLRLMRQHPHQPPNPQHLGLMHASGKHLVNVINDLLDFAKLESAGLPISPHPFRLDQMLQATTDLLRMHGANKGLALDLEAPPETARWVLGDETRLRQILLNLLGNAIKFTESGRVHLVVRRDARTGWTQLQVHDTGSGIPPEDLERIFEPFHQSEGTYERRFGGTGLGLTISRELCKAMGGHLRCNSQVGQGSVFTCELPLPDAEAPADPRHTSIDTLPAALDEPGAPAQARTATVLLVDDNPVNTLVAEAELRALGLAVHTADSAAVALAWLDQHRADLVLMDCEMPVMDGITATVEIRQREQQRQLEPTPIVALTANGRAAYEHRCQAAGMNDFLGKPFDRADLLAMLQRQLPTFFGAERSPMPSTRQTSPP